ncbi:ComEA family DNA-binding protein [Alcaligenes sp. SDU_A2]|uniref:ComEA family DNA-binding protein n=1 Tax=Alcaligenes sp. SDU_A2 TaxID=3136634 RepID=UPI00311E63C3
MALWLVFCPGFVAAVDLNTATAEQLQQIKGIGPRTAQLILEERQRGGDFDSLQNLADRVKGIGPKKIGTMEQSGLTAGASKKPAASSVAPRPGVDIRKKP